MMKRQEIQILTFPLALYGQTCLKIGAVQNAAREKVILN
jgi:hypothetical protein